MSRLLCFVWLFCISAGILCAQTCDTFVGGYIPSYRDPATVDYSKLSHVFYAFAGTNDNGDLLVDNTSFSSFSTATAGKQRFLSLAGGGAHEAYSSMAANESSIATFTQHCIAFCKENDLQGIDMDWESITTVQDSIRFGKLVRSLEQALHAEDLSLVITLGYGSYGGDHYNIGALKKADWIQLMVYDQTGTWNESPYGNHASFQHMLDAIQYWKNRGYNDVSNMVIGVPFYGYTFSSNAGGLATAETYAAIATAHPALACDADETGLTVFNGPATIREKVEYVKSNGLKGIMIWEMGQDLPSTHEKSLLRAISLAACELPASCSTTPVTSIDAEVLNHARLMQNPVETSVSLSLSNPEKVSGIEIKDVSGRTLFRKESSFESSEQIDVSKQSTGIYILRIDMRDQKNVIMRFVKK